MPLQMLTSIAHRIAAGSHQYFWLGIRGSIYVRATFSRRTTRAEAANHRKSSEVQKKGPKDGSPGSLSHADFNCMSPKEAVDTILARLFGREGGRIYYANAHTMVTAAKDERLKTALSATDMLLADGSGVRWGSKLLGTPLGDNLNGTDLVPALCKAGEAKGLSVYLLGAEPGVAEEAAFKMKERYPGLVIAGSRNGYFAVDQTDDVVAEIRDANPHILLVAMGVPKQEIWIDEHADQLPNIACMGVGGLFDFLAERVPRAPMLFRKTGFEWLWRLVMEPRRLWKRYIIGNVVFMGLVFANG